MLISKKNLIASLSVITTFFLKTKIKSHGNAVIDFYDKKSPKVESNYTCYILLPRKMTINIYKCFQKSANILRKR